jgi:hypothetical protein
MSNGEKGSFIRWQGKTNEQLGYVNNLFTGLATGLLAFQTNLAFNDKADLTMPERVLIIISLTSLGVSLAFGCHVALNRLEAFRSTAQIARKREKEEREGIEELRESTNARDKETWKYLEKQIITFAMGGALLLVASIFRYLR